MTSPESGEHMRADIAQHHHVADVDQVNLDALCDSCSLSNRVDTPADVMIGQWMVKHLSMDGTTKELMENTETRSCHGIPRRLSGRA